LSLKATQILVMAIAACHRQNEPAVPLMRIASHDYGYEMPARIAGRLVHLRPW
jgi:hypothetical protein